jgi:hypothetical protein
MDMCLRDRFSDRARLGHNLESGPAVEKGHEALPDDLVVVDDQKAERPSCFRIGHRQVVSEI